MHHGNIVPMSNRTIGVGRELLRPLFITAPSPVHGVYLRMSTPDQSTTPDSLAAVLLGPSCGSGVEHRRDPHRDRVTGR